MTRSKFFIFICLMILYTACKESSPKPAEIVGDYKVSFSLNDEVKLSDSIKMAIENARTEIQHELQQAKETMKDEFNTNEIDTSTVEGKLEYKSLKLTQSMADLGPDLGRLGAELGLNAASLAGDGVSWAANMLQSIELDVTLQADGDIKVSGSPFFSFGFNDATWRVHEDHLLFQRSKSSPIDTLQIVSSDHTGLKLKKDNFLIQLTKK